MLLLADSGSTKTDWRIVQPNGQTVKEFKTQGFNPYFKSPEQIKIDLQKQIPETIRGLSRVVFYGAGCSQAQKAGELAGVLDEVFPAAMPAEVQGDILGAARSLFQDRPGIACILGTGASSCVYNGEIIVGSVPSLGFILGDEGSGAVLGKDFVHMLLSEKLPQSLRDEFFEKSGLDRVAILDRIYRHAFPNRFLASLIPFIHHHQFYPEINQLLVDNFSRFFQNFIVPYRQQGMTHQLAFAGSVAYHFREVIMEVGKKFDESVAEICPKPMEGLVRYHCHRDLYSN
jgi:glucosamine kinase